MGEIDINYYKNKMKDLYNKELLRKCVKVEIRLKTLEKKTDSKSSWLINSEKKSNFSILMFF